MSDSDTTSPDQQTDAAAKNATGPGVGALLRETRQKAGLDVADVARVLRISQKYLEALEDGRNADLPGTPYAIGFVRSYAEHLHLDGEEIVRRYKDEAEGLAGRTDLVFPKPIPDGGVPGAAVLGLGVIAAAVVYGIWYWNSNNDTVEVARVDPVPEHLAAAAPTTVDTGEPVSAPEPMETEPSPAVTPEPSISAPETPAPEMAETTAEEAAETVGETTDEAVQQVEQVAAEMVEEAAASAETTDSEISATVQAVEQTQVQTEAQTEEQATEAVVEAAAPASEPETEASAEPEAAVETQPDEPAPEVAAVPSAREDDGPSRITVRAKSNSWIQVRDEVADRLLFTRLLREGDTYEVPNRAGLRLMTGNAGALELLVDGEVAPAIGEVGEVRRNVELDPDKLKSGEAEGQ